MFNRYAMKTDVAIIGAGPTGLFAVFQCGMLGLRSSVIDSLPEIGGQCTALYPEKPIYDIPGCPEIEAFRLIENLERQARPFGPVYHLGQQAQKLARSGSNWIISTSAGTEIEAGAVIIAAGSGSFGPNRPPLENIEVFENKSVFYLIRDKSALAGKRIVIAGGGDSAVDWALNLAGTAKRLYMVHRRENFRAAPENTGKLNALVGKGLVELVAPYQLKSIEGSDGILETVTVSSVCGNGERVLEADVLLPFFGLAAKLGPLEDWGLDIVSGHIRIDQSTGETGLPGIFAAGDIVTYQGKLRLILTGFAEASQAAHSAFRLIRPDQELHFEYSTSKGIPGKP